MPTPKVKFDWSSLDRETIVGFMLLISSDIVDKTWNIDKLHYKLTARLKKLIPVKFKKNFNYKITDDMIWVGGTYYSDLDKAKKKCIEIILEYPINDNIYLTNIRYKKICYNIADTVLHELIHMRQFRRRKFKYLPDYASTAEKDKLKTEQTYLGSSDEIDAYSFNIACELVESFNNDEFKIIQYLNENQKGLRRKHNSWRMYLTAFEHDHNHPIIQRMKRKIVRYLPLAQIGKPYRNKDWIYR
jgi:hypothetical protein